MLSPFDVLPELIVIPENVVSLLCRVLFVKLLATDPSPSMVMFDGLILELLRLSKLSKSLSCHSFANFVAFFALISLVVLMSKIVRLFYWRWSRSYGLAVVTNTPLFAMNYWSTFRG